jgi:SpoIID/LytB domain protein
MGATAGRMGWPTSGEYDITIGRAQDFQNGRITWNRSTNEVKTEVLGVATAAGVDMAERPPDGVFRFLGRGYGHGRGLSQWGSFQAASTGATWPSIVGFYYPGTTVATQDSGTVRVRLEGDTGYDLIVRPEPGLRILWTNEGGTKMDSTAPTQLGDCGPRWWRVRAVGSDQAIEYLCDDWRTWQPTSAVRGNAPVTFRTSDGITDTAIRAGGSFVRKAYRGDIEGVNSGGSIVVTNIVAMEAYLRSVVANEVPPSWPTEALRAQAVAARTYAMRERRDRSDQSFHVYDSTRSQVYPGVRLYDEQWNVVRSYEDGRTDAAVQATAGRFLLSAGVPAFTQFSSSNGGWTAAGSFSYLPQQRDDWDRSATANPYRQWSGSVSAATLESRYPQVGRLIRIRVLERSGGGEWGGRVLRMALEGSSGSVTVSGDTGIRAALGARSSDLAFG